MSIKDEQIISCGSLIGIDKFVREFCNKNSFNYKEILLSFYEKTNLSIDKIDEENLNFSKDPKFFHLLLRNMNFVKYCDEIYLITKHKNMTNVMKHLELMCKKFNKKLFIV